MANYLPPDTQCLTTPDWIANVASQYTAPLIGSRKDTAPHRSPERRTLAQWPTTADVYGGAGNAAYADVASDESLFGDTVVQLTTSGATEYLIKPVEPNLLAFNGLDGIIRFKFRPVSGLNGIGTFRIELFSHGSPSNPPPDFHRASHGIDFKSRLTMGLTANTPGRMQGYSIPVSAFQPIGNGADLNNLSWAQIRINCSSGSLVIQPALIEWEPIALDKAKVIIGFDDAHKAQLTTAARMMNKHGFRGVLYPSPAANRVGTDPNTMINPKQIIKLHDELGWQIASQAWNTESATTINNMTVEQLMEEFSKLRNWHSALGVTGGLHGSYFNMTGPSQLIAHQAFRKFFRSMRCFYNGNSGGAAPFDYGETFPYGDPFVIRAWNGGQFTGDLATTRLIEHVQQAITHKGVAYIIYHNELRPDLPQYTEPFRLFLEWLDASRSVVDVVTEEELVNRL